MSEAVYNKIGKSYDITRKPDAQIIKTLLRLLQPQNQGRYLDLGCGSGNYTDALNKHGLAIEGVDVSEEMISKARVKNPNIIWHLGDAAKLPFENNLFDGAICTLATHHMNNVEAAFKEANRVMKSGKFVMLTATPEQMNNYWLKYYFPLMMKDAARKMSSFSQIEKLYSDAGFTGIAQEPFFVTNELTDWFLHAGKYRPEIYLDEKVRAGISSFHLSINENELERGLINLKSDIDSGKIQKIIEQFENKIGEYLFVVGEKK